jgi:hypothetical protein
MLNCVECEGSEVEILLMILKLENRTGAYSWREQLQFSELAGELGITPGGGAEKVSAALIGNSGFFQRIEKFKILKPWIQSLVEAGKLDLKIAARLDKLPREACDLSGRLPGFSFSDVRVFLTLFHEIILRDNLSPDNSSRFAEELLADDSPLERIVEIRSPELTDLHRRFSDVQHTYLSETGIKMSSPKHFEGDSYSITFSFRNRADLEKKTHVLANLGGACDELEDLL